MMFLTGEMLMLTDEEVRKFILNFDSFEIDESMLLVAAPNFDVSMGEHLAVLSEFDELMYEFFGITNHEIK